MRSVTIYSYILSIAAAVGHAAYHLGRMPEPMAVHFGPEGAADGWSSKTEYISIAAVVLVMNLLIFGAGPWVVKFGKIRKLALPNRSHWLSGEHIGEFYVYFREKMAWFGIGNIVFGVVVNQMVFSANSLPVPMLDSRLFLVFLTGYFVFVIIWLFTLFRKLQKKV